MGALPPRRHAIRASLSPSVRRAGEQPTPVQRSYEQSRLSTTEGGLSSVAVAIESELIDTRTSPNTNQEPHMSELFQGARLQVCAFQLDRDLDITGAEANLESTEHLRNRLAGQRHSLSRRCDIRRLKGIEHLDRQPSPRRNHLQTPRAAPYSIRQMVRVVGHLSESKYVNFAQRTAGSPGRESESLPIGKRLRSTRAKIIWPHVM